MSYRKHLMPSDMPPSELYKATEVGAEVINRQKAIEIVEKYFKKVGLNGDICVDGLRQLPPIQSDIVRCKDCRYYDFEEKECLDLLGHGRRWEEDDFCSYAERRWRRKHESN